MKRLRHAELVVYPDSTDIDNVKVKMTSADHWLLSPFHDRDVKADGSPVKGHYHLYLSFVNARTTQALANAYGVKDNQVEEIHGSLADCMIYATHENEPEKAQYSRDDILCDDLDFWSKATNKGGNDNVVEMFDDMYYKCLPPRAMLVKYGQRFVYNYKVLAELCREQRRYDYETQDSKK